MKIVYRLAFKYAFSNAKNQRRSTIVIILGVAVSFIAMLLLSSVMNGLQSSQLDRLRNLDSFDVVIEDTELTYDEILKIQNVDYAYEFIDANVLITNIKNGHSGTARVRGIDLEAYQNRRTENDFSYMSYSEDSGLTLSTTMKNRFYVSIGDTLQLTFLRKGKTTVAPYNRNFEVSGLYVSSLSDFSSNTAFVDIEDIKSIYGSSYVKIGIFCNQNVEDVCSRLSELDPGAKITSWKEANRALYSALMLEKTLMYLFLCFVFIIISVNLKNSTKRLLDNKVGESAILRTCGMSKGSIYLIFILQGVIATTIGSVIGLAVGFVLVKQLPYLMNFADIVISRISGSTSYLSSLPLMAYFNWTEALLLMLYIFVLTVLFAYLGCRKIHKLEIMEVLSDASVKI